MKRVPAPSPEEASIRPPCSGIMVRVIWAMLEREVRGDFMSCPNSAINWPLSVSSPFFTQKML